MPAFAHRFSRFILIVLLCSGFAQAESGAESGAESDSTPHPNTHDNPTILVMGDSLSAHYGMTATEGWVTLLEARLAEHDYPHRVVNASVSGETSEGGVHRLPRLLDEHQPDWVILELGGNDGLRGYPMTALRSNLEQMVTLSRNSGARVILFGMQIPPNYGPRYTQQFTDIYPALANDLDLAWVPFMLEGVATDTTLMQSDGIHPNATAQPKILDVVWPVIERALQNAP